MNKNKENNDSLQGWTKQEVIAFLNGSIKNHIKLVKWLYDNHRDVLREYEKTRGKLRVEFL